MYARKCAKGNVQMFLDQKYNACLSVEPIFTTQRDRDTATITYCLGDTRKIVIN